MIHSEAVQSQLNTLFKNLGFPSIVMHEPKSHFDFRAASRRILVVGPMGSGKTEYAAHVWRDAQVARSKSAAVQRMTSGSNAQKDLFDRESGIGSADRRYTFFVRPALDKDRFPGYPDDALAHRGGYERCGSAIAAINNSFQLEALITENPHIGTWIVDEASFYDERLAYVIKKESERRGLVFVMPTLLLNFRGEIFNPTARLLVETATEIYPFSAYCEHCDCLENGYNTYRYYTVNGTECPALYFDPLIIIGGDRKKEDPFEPNYCTRCDDHHFLPGKQYTFFTLKPLGLEASRGNIQPLTDELAAMHDNLEKSELYATFKSEYLDSASPSPERMNALRVPCLAERALVFLFAEQNLLSADQMRRLVAELDLNKDYLDKRLSDNKRPLTWN
ncbi:MAG: thymidine kinase [Treponema sp.]